MKVNNKYLITLIIGILFFNVSKAQANLQFNQVKLVTTVDTVPAKKSMEGLSKILPSKVQRGIGVFVTNDGSYKEGPRESAGYANFSLHECREISAGQSLKWNRKKKFKSKLKNIQIQNACKISWHDMDNLPNHMFCII